MQLQKENIENMEQMNTTKEYRSDKYINYTNHSNDTETGLYDSMIDSNFCQPEILSLLINCVHARMNIAFCGEPGVGKTECSKFSRQFIPANQRVITIEDNLEMHSMR